MWQHHTTSTFSDPRLYPLIKHASSEVELHSQTLFHVLLHGVPSGAGRKNHQWKRRLEGLGLQELLDLQQCRQPVHVLLCHVLTLHFGRKQQHEPTGSQELLLCLHGIEGTITKRTVGHLERQPDHQDGCTGGQIKSEHQPQREHSQSLTALQVGLPLWGQELVQEIGETMNPASGENCVWQFNLNSYLKQVSKQISLYWQKKERQASSRKGIPTHF